jgi:hypothetical protein
VAGHRRRHQPDRARADDEDVLAEDREAQRGVHRVPERIEDRRDLLVDPGPVVPDVRDRQHDLLREGAVAVDAEADRVRAEVVAARPAVPAAPADDVALAADESPGWRVADVAADLEHLADELVADDERRLDRPGAHGSHDSMWRSVPQIPVLWTRIRTSLIPIGGSGTSVRTRPGRPMLHERAHDRFSVPGRRASGCARGSLGLGDGSA